MEKGLYSSTGVRSDLNQNLNRSYNDSSSGISGDYVGEGNGSGMGTNWKSKYSAALLSPKYNRAKTILIGVLVLLNFIFLGLLIYFFINPPFLYQQNFTRQLVDSVSKLSVVNTLETPTVAMVSDPEALRKENSIQAQVYKDAQAGDYVLVWSDNRMVIYRKAENKIVYDGKSPLQIAQDTQKALSDQVVQLSTAANLLTANKEETPQLQVVVDATALQKQEPAFYAKAQKDDVLAFFPENRVVLIYRPATKEIINSGKYQVAIGR